jgi:type IV pilus assembly protein PilM
MAESPTSVVLNIGSQRIGMAVFEVTKNSGLLLKAYETESIIADPALDASRISQTRVAVADLAKRLKVGKTKARYAISGQAVFTRFVKLPPLQDDNIEQLVTFEAQQHVPFPINEVVWDYELIEGSGENEVVIVAIKGDALDEINSAVNDADLATAEVDIAPMALYNAFRAAYGKPEEPILLIDIGAKTSNLLYIEGKRFFTRSIAIGGTSVTAAIAKEYGISFSDAEGQKITNGLVALGGGHTEQLDESVAALAMVIRNALTRLPAEIARTTNYYRSQHGGSAPRRILLAGGGANLPYTLEFFQEKLNLPVEYFNPLKSVAVGKGVDVTALQGEAHLMGELVGLGLRAAGKSSINIDLVPAVVEQARAADRRKPFLIAAAAVFLLGMTVWAVSRNIAAGKAAEQARSMAESAETLRPVVGAIEGLLKKQGEAQTVANAYTSVEADHAFWLDLLAEVRGAFASDAAWITDLEPIHGFVPLPPPDFKGTNGRTVVNAGYATTAYGATSVVDIKIEAPQEGRRPGGRNQPPPVAKTATANAIRIKGLWRENPRAHNVVSDLLKRLREKPGSFTFTVKGPDGKPVELRDEQVLSVTSVAEGAELALPFEITLPLAREIPIK